MNPKTSVALVSTSALAAGMAHGAITYSGPLNRQQTWVSGVDSRQPVDMNGDGINDFTFGYETTDTSNKPYVDARTTFNAQSGLVSFLAKPNNGLPVTTFGTMIDQAYATTFPVAAGSIGARAYMYYNDQGNTIIGDWPNTAVTDAYVGIELALAGGTSYGWLHLIEDPTASTPSLTLVDWAYENDPGVGITAGAVPEPSTFGLAGLGLATLLISRKRR